MSKKLAAGLQSLVLDVKCGNGAFMDAPETARELAESLTGVAQAAGLPCHALITDMNQPLATAAGNAVEVANAVAFLTGEARDDRLEAVTLALAGEMLRLAGIAATDEDGLARARDALGSGKAAEVLGRMVTELGGPSDFVTRYRDHLPVAPIVRPLAAERSGYVAGIATRDIGLAVVELGGGRRKASDTVDPRVGVTGLLPLGAEAGPDQPLAMIHAADEESADARGRPAGRGLHGVGYRAGPGAGHPRADRLTGRLSMSFDARSAPAVISMQAAAMVHVAELTPAAMRMSVDNSGAA